MKEAYREVYYIEDDPDIARLVRAYLEQRAYRVIILPTIEEAKAALDRRLPDLVLIDWNMPDGRGDRLCSYIRTKYQKLPVIFLTVCGEARHMVAGLESGADDYIVKPFELEVLYARMEAVLRRAGNALTGGMSDRLFCGEISVDRVSRRVYAGGQETELTAVEYELLVLLMENQGRTLTRERILEQIWDVKGSYVNDNTLTVTMKRLREKLHTPACIQTIRSIGYRMEDISIEEK
ncbi:MAG: response regulator transcription factor [Lachnospiraceae bacterium]|nr:response regulator transcription factor [Lachnospiraceae bacterium]